MSDENTTKIKLCGLVRVYFFRVFFYQKYEYDLREVGTEKKMTADICAAFAGKMRISAAAPTVFELLEWGFGEEELVTHLRREHEHLQYIANHLLSLALYYGRTTGFEHIERELKPSTIDWPLMFAEACAGQHILAMRYVIHRAPEVLPPMSTWALWNIGKSGDPDIITAVASKLSIQGYYWLARGAGDMKDDRQCQAATQALVHNLYHEALDREKLRDVDICVPYPHQLSLTQK